MRLAETVTFGGSGLDRGGAVRGDAAELARLYPSSRVLTYWRGRPLLAGEARDRLGWLDPDHPMLREVEPAEPVFLGFDDGVAVFARDVSAWEAPKAEGEVDPARPTPLFDPGETRHPSLAEDQAFAELRGAMVRLTAREAELAATARAVLGWHQTHRFCARCGAPTVMAQGGWQRHCAACDSQHFPRTDPVVIMLVTRGNSVLIGRSPGWPEGMYSLLAGFIEPGETVEAAVRREVWEEAGVKVGAVRYLASQPWPFPASLMLGCQGEALSEEITIDPAEIEAARWVTREEMVEIMAGGNPEVKPSRKGAIAHFLIAQWLADRLD